MRVWEYADSSDTPQISESRCPFCRRLLRLLATTSGVDIEEAKDPLAGYRSELRVCRRCGWWCVSSESSFSDGPGRTDETRGCSGVLKRLDIADISAPADEVRKYLLHRYRDRFKVHPRKFEEVVGSVFEDFGYRVRVTAYSGDDGLDAVILDGNEDATVGIQVKRYRNDIQPIQIREFGGALYLGRLKRGVFVTTSDYSKGANSTAQKFTERGMSIELWDSKSFFSALEITTRKQYRDPNDPTAPFAGFWPRPRCLIGEEWVGFE